MMNLNPVFLDRMKQILGDEFPAFLSAMNEPEQKSIYVNENKISINKFREIVDFPIEQIPYERAGFYIDHEKKGRHPLHHAGAFYIQEPSAMFTVNCFKFSGNERVLDMCAAPGGKSIQIANRIPNGVLVSNEVVRSRAEILYSNIERMGLKNVIITNSTSENIAAVYPDTFDVCLVDAPCSGEGMFRRGDEVIREWNEHLPKMCAKRQLEILENADKALKQGGHLIYSTCTYSLEENEEVIKNFLSKHDYELVYIDAPFSRGIGLSEAVRLYPHKVKGEGQFVALLKKLETNENKSTQKRIKLPMDVNFKNFLSNYLDIKDNIYSYGQYSYIVADPDLIRTGMNYLSLGVRVGENKGKYFELNHYLFSAFGNQFYNKVLLKSNDDIDGYLHGDSLTISGKDGYGAVFIGGCVVGGFKLSAGKFKNLYPKGLRNTKIG